MNILKLSKGSKYRLALGLVVIAGVLLVLATAKYNIPAAVAVAATLVGFGFEGYRYLRGPFAFSFSKAISIASPGLLFWVVFAALGIK